MPNDEQHTISDQFLGGSDCLLRIAEIVSHDQLHLLAQHAARSIDVGDGQLRTPLQLLACPCELTRHRSCDPDQNVGANGVTHHGCQQGDG